MYAVNVCDLTACCSRREGLSAVQVLLVDFCAKDSLHFSLDDNMDSAVVVLDGPAANDEKRVNALIQVLQKIIGPRKIGRHIRCYKQGPRGGWKEVRSEDAQEAPARVGNCR